MDELQELSNFLESKIKTMNKLINVKNDEQVCFNCRYSYKDTLVRICIKNQGKAVPALGHCSKFEFKSALAKKV